MTFKGNHLIMVNISPVMTEPSGTVTEGSRFSLVSVIFIIVWYVLYKVVLMSYLVEIVYD